VEYRVRSGDSLWTIARRVGTTVERLKSENGLSSNRIYAGQVIEVPVSTN
jgi:LysM repeat protein